MGGYVGGWCGAEYEHECMGVMEDGARVCVCVCVCVCACVCECSVLNACLCVI